MKAKSNTALQNFLAANRLWTMAELITLTLAGGAVAHYTDYDQDLTIGGQTYLSGDVRWKAKSRQEAVGVAVATATFEAAPLPTSILSGGSFLGAILSGVCDGGRLKHQRLIMATPGNTSLGTVIMFEGRISDLDPGRSLVTFTVKADLEVLNIQMPRNLYQAGCLHEVYDGGCTLSAASFSVGGTVAAGSTATVINVSATEGTAYFNQGVITFNTGVNTGLSRTIKSWVGGTPGTVTTLFAFPNAPATGDSLTLRPGCDKQQSTCSGKFNNLVHFRGMPYIPQPEQAYY